MGKRAQRVGRVVTRALALVLGALLLMSLRTAPVPPAAARSIGGAGAIVEVPTYVQQRNLSCEYASLVIALGHYGVNVSEYEFDDLVGWSENPHFGFRGDINGVWGNTTDYGVYAEALVRPLAQFGFRGVAFYGKGDASQLQRYLDNDVPVLVWLGFWGDQSYIEYASDGTAFKLNQGNHVVVAYGYDDSGVLISDPATGSVSSVAWDDFMAMWNVLNGMGLATWPVAYAVAAPPPKQSGVCC
jgi:uncharacterized protein YvpB